MYVNICFHRENGGTLGMVAWGTWPAENVLPISSAPVTVLLSDMFKLVALHSHKSNVK